MPPRGRPPKRPQEEEAAGSPKKAKVDDGEQPKRGRGRPPKPKSDAPEPPAAPKEDGPKRGRGRPPKAKPADAPAAAPSADGPKRGRGRPPKNPPAAAPVADTTDAAEAAPETAAAPEEEKAPAEEKEAEAEGEKKEQKGGKLEVGDVCPDFELTTDEGTTVHVADLYKTSGLVVFMYPKANTGGCTKQALGFKEHHAAITAAGYEVFGLSADSPTSQANWRAKHSFPYRLLCDPKFEAIKKFGAFKAPKNIRRSHIIIENGGKVKDIRNDISPGDSFAEALATVTKS